MYGNRVKYEIARLIQFTIKRKKDKIHNLVILMNVYDDYVVIDLKDKRKYLRKGFCVVGYFDYIPTETNINLSNIVEEVFNYE